jgi:hypothetical protein
MAKIINSIKYLGKNFWKVLPIGSSLNYEIKNRAKDKSKTTEYNLGDNYTLKEIFHDFYALAGVFAVSGYLGFVGLTKEWSPKKQFEEYNRMESERKKNENRRVIVEKKYNGMFESENPKTFQDSVEIYLKYGLPIKLLEPSFQQKQEAINRLERSLKAEVRE